MPQLPRPRRVALLAGVGALVVAVFLAGALAGGPVLDLVLPPRGSLPDQVADAIVERFEGPVDRVALERAGAVAIAGSVGDRWTAYFTPKEWAAIKRSSEGAYTGIGIALRLDDDALIIEEVYPQSPAAHAGLDPGDAIVAVAGVPVARLGAAKSRDALLGREGTTVALRVRSASGVSRTVRVTRGDVEVPMVRARMLTGPAGEKAGLVVVVRFGEGAGEQVEQQAKRLVREGAAAVVLDLRGNPGGLLDEAVAVAGVFLPPGQVVVSTSGRTSPRRERRADGDPIPAGIPVAVLVDSASASASEIVAGALRDHDRAVVVGEPTFGKAKVQVTAETSDGGAVRVTSATYLTPDGTDIGDGGVRPTVQAVDVRGTAEDEAVQAAVQAALDRRG